jgi:Resolvase, N terminal domain
MSRISGEELKLLRVLGDGPRTMPAGVQETMLGFARFPVDFLALLRDGCLWRAGGRKTPMYGNRSFHDQNAHDPDRGAGTDSVRHLRANANRFPCLRRFDQLLVYKLDRLGRETRLTLEAVAALEQCGVQVKSMTEEFDTATASGRLMSVTWVNARENAR